MMWRDLFVALALLLVLEGILPFLNPSRMRRTLLLISDMTDSQLRFAGISSMLIGITLLYIVH
jgi:hypothetical protein